MSFSSIMRQTEKVILDNAPLIATAVGVAGTITTAVLTGQATYKSVRAIEEENTSRELMNQPPAKPHEIAAVVWKYYIPPVAIGLVTVGAIISANRISTKRAAALAAAYSLSEKAFGEYREKIVERFNSSQEERVRDEIAQDRVRNDPPRTDEVVITGNGDVMCYDTLTGRYFMSTIEKIRAAVNVINKRVLDDGYASLTEFYTELGLQGTAFSEEVGWKDNSQLEMKYSTVLSEDGRPCIAMTYTTMPVRDYFRYHLR